MWATYDSWVLPWYLLAALLASLDWWFCSGLALAVGAMFKGQQLAVVSVFIIWPLIQGRVGAALRWCIGLAVGFAAVTSPWLMTYLPADRLQAARNIQANLAVSQYPPDLFVIPRVFDVPAAIWIFEMLIVAAAVPWLLRTLRPTESAPQPTRVKTILYSQQAWIAGAVIFIIAAVYWPWLLPQNRSIWYFGLLAGVRLRPRRCCYPAGSNLLSSPLLPVVVCSLACCYSMDLTRGGIAHSITARFTGLT